MCFRLPYGTEYSQMTLNVVHLFVAEDSVLSLFITFSRAQKRVSHCIINKHPSLFCWNFLFICQLNSSMGKNIWKADYNGCTCFEIMGSPKNYNSVILKFVLCRL
jgi:hypothetical protein